MPINFKKAFITGGAGFIGSHIAEELVNSGCQVTVVDNLTSGHLENFNGFMDKIRFVKGDIRDEALMASHMKACDVVFHQAAVVSVTQTVSDPIGSTSVNDMGTLQVLESARHNGVKRVVLASSSAVYGDDPELPKVESMTAGLLSPYAVQKFTNELYADLYYRLYGLETVCLRYFNVYGPRQDPSSPYSGVISIFMQRASSDTVPTIYGDGQQTRDFIYVKDVVQANLLAATNNSCPGHVFNVGTGKAIAIKDLWYKVAGLNNSEADPEYSSPRPGDIVHSLASIQKAIDTLRFKPAVSFSEGLTQTLAWYQKNL